MGEVTREAIRQWPHHQTPQRRNPREETREVTPQPNLPQRKEREAKRRSHLHRKMARDQRTAKDQRVPRNGECATVRRSWRHPNVTASTTLLIPGPRLSALPCPWVTSAVSASHHHRPRERIGSPQLLPANGEKQPWLL